MKLFQYCGGDIFINCNMKNPADTIVSDVLDRLRQIMVDKRITQATLADYANVEPSQFSKIINGKVALRVSHLANIASNLGMSIIDIISYPDVYEKKEIGSEKIKTSVTIEIEGNTKEQILRILSKENLFDFLIK